MVAEVDVQLGVQPLGGACYSWPETGGNCGLASPTPPAQSPHLVMSQGVQSLPVILNFGGDVFVL